VYKQASAMCATITVTIRSNRYRDGSNHYRVGNCTANMKLGSFDRSTKRIRKTNSIASMNCYGEALVKKRAFPRVASYRSKAASQVIKNGQTTFSNWAECFKRQWNETAC